MGLPILSVPEENACGCVERATGGSECICSTSGLVHITQLPNDYYHFDPKRHLLTGERRGLTFRIGQPVRIQVLRASIEDRKIDFRLVAAEGTPVPSPHDHSAPGRKQAIGRRR